MESRTMSEPRFSAPGSGSRRPASAPLVPASTSPSTYCFLNSATLALSLKNSCMRVLSCLWYARYPFSFVTPVVSFLSSADLSPVSKRFTASPSTIRYLASLVSTSLFMAVPYRSDRNFSVSNLERFLSSAPPMPERVANWRSSGSVILAAAAAPLAFAAASLASSSMARSLPAADASRASAFAVRPDADTACLKISSDSARTNPSAKFRAAYPATLGFVATREASPREALPALVKSLPTPPKRSAPPAAIIAPIGPPTAAPAAAAPAIMVEDRPISTMNGMDEWITEPTWYLQLRSDSICCWSRKRRTPRASCVVTLSPLWSFRMVLAMSIDSPTVRPPSTIHPRNGMSASAFL